jgi:hypothetical protein
LIPVDQWPGEIADAVKAIKHTPFNPTIVMYDKQKACELMAGSSSRLASEEPPMPVVRVTPRTPSSSSLRT